MLVRHALTIHREPGYVFRWIEDPALASRWQPEVVGYEITRAGPDPTGRSLAGTEFREVLGGGRGATELRGRVTAHVPDRRMEFELTGRGIRIRSRYLVEPADDGTRLSVDTDIHLGGWFSFLLEPLVRGRIAGQQRTELEALRHLCEAESGPGPGADPPA